MINRSPGKSEQATSVQQKVFTCSTGDVLSGAAINGRVIDRLGLGGNTIFQTAEPSICVYTTVGSTAADKRVTLGIKLQHGDSSGGGDMADYSTGFQSADKNFWTTAESTAYQNWSTGLQYFSHQSYYEVTAAKRYVRAVGFVTRGGNTTSTAASSIDTIYANMDVRFGEAAHFPLPSSTSTSTSTST